jgi:phenylalanyl-tRNA synthetase beta chain
MDFFDLKGVVEALLDRLGFSTAQIEYRARPDTGSFGPRCAEVVVNGESLGLMGEVHPQVRNAFGISAGRVNAAEFRLQPLVKPHFRLQPMQPISSYPAVVEDLAFEVAEEITTRQVENVIRRIGGDVLAHLELFDIYRGEPLPAGNKSMAYRLTYQHVNRIVAEKEVAALRARIIQAVERETGGKLRG